MASINCRHLFPTHNQKLPGKMGLCVTLNYISIAESCVITSVLGQNFLHLPQCILVVGSVLPVELDSIPGSFSAYCTLDFHHLSATDLWNYLASNEVNTVKQRVFLNYLIATANQY